MNALEYFTFRRPTEADAQAVLDLIATCEIADYGEAEESLDDLLDQWSDIDLAQDAWLAYSPEQQLAGYAAVSSGRVYSIDFYTLPRPDKLALSISLLQMCEARAKELQAQKVMTFLPHVNQVDRQAVEAAGFKAERYHFRMQIEFDAPPPAPKWPEGIELRTIAPGQDDRRVYDFIQEAFERPGRTPPPFEQWRDFMMRPDHFSPKLWWLAFYQGKLVGANLCFDYPQHGWVRQLGVAPPLRKQGLGGALLLHCFGVFYARGHKQVALGVDSENERAVHFYEGVGMHCVRQYDEYHKSFGIDE